MTAIYICKDHKFAGTNQCRCVNAEVHIMGPKWRIPKKNNKKAWALIANGDIWWDKKAVSKSALVHAETLRLYNEKLKERSRMSYPVWPQISINYRTTQTGVECTMRTSYRGVKISATETDLDVDKAGRAAKFNLNKKIASRKSFE